ncbi:MAG: S8 family serine peptidase [Gemmatimonadales bacterium]
MHRMPRLAALVAAALFVAGCGDSPTNNLGPTPAAPSSQDSVRPYYVRWRSADLAALSRKPALLRDAGAEGVVDLTPKSPHAGVGGMIARMTRAQAAKLAADPDIAYIEAEIPIHAVGSPWNIDRVDQRALPLDARYVPMSGAGQGTQVIIFDTGIHGVHQEFGGRVGAGWSGYGGTSDDCHGHGTHVAGTAAGATVGVATGATLIAYRVLDCNGSGSSLVLAQAVNALLSARAAQASPPPAVINLSLGTPVGQPSQAIDDAVNAAVRAGITVVVAAGNDNGDACTTSPARVPAAITVAASSISNLSLSPGARDVPASFSNWGSCVTLFAPGVSVLSADGRTTSGYLTMSGTSMAAPHVTGAVALLLARTPRATPADIKASLVARATASAVDSVRGGTANRLLFVGEVATAPTPTVTALVLSPASAALRSGATQAFTVQERLSDGTLRAATGVTLSATAGSITAAGVFTAPATAGTVTITAARSPLSATAQVSVTAPVALVLSPASATVRAGDSLPLAATERFADGFTRPAATVTWSSAAGGTISSAGRFAAGNTASSVVVTARAGSLSATATLGIVRLTRLTITPASSTLWAGTTQQFSAQESFSDGVTRTASGLTWSSSSGGSIGSTGLFAAGSASATVTVTGAKLGITATAQAGILKATSLALTPGVDTIYRGGQRRFAATLRSDQGQTLPLATIPWSAVAGGTIGADGLTYTAGTQTGTFTLRATHPSGVTASSTVVILNRAPVAALQQVGACVGRTCTFSAARSTDDLPLSGLTVAWAINDVTRAIGGYSSWSQVAVTFPSAGTWSIMVTVTDQDRTSSSARVTVTVP